MRSCVRVTHLLLEWNVNIKFPLPELTEKLRLVSHYCSQVLWFPGRSWSYQCPCGLSSVVKKIHSKMNLKKQFFTAQLWFRSCHIFRVITDGVFVTHRILQYDTHGFRDRLELAAIQQDSLHPWQCPSRLFVFRAIPIQSNLFCWIRIWISWWIGWWTGELCQVNLGEVSMVELDTRGIQV